MNVIRLPEIKTAELSTYGNFTMCHQAHFRVSRVGLGTGLEHIMVCSMHSYKPSRCDVPVRLLQLLPGDEKLTGLRSVTLNSL